MARFKLSTFMNSSKAKFCDICQVDFVLGDKTTTELYKKKAEIIRKTYHRQCLWDKNKLARQQQ